MKNLLLVALLSHILMISCGTRYEIRTVDAIITEKIFRPECIIDSIEYNADGTILCEKNAYFPAEYFFKIQYEFKEKIITVNYEQFSEYNLRDTMTVTFKTPKAYVPENMALVKKRCVITEKFYFPESMKMFTRKVEQNGFYREEIVESYGFGKAVMNGIDLETGERIENMRIQFYNNPKGDEHLVITNLQLLDTVELSVQKIKSFY
jgi:hypothetical protein